MKKFAKHAKLLLVSTFILVFLGISTIFVCVNGGEPVLYNLIIDIAANGEGGNNDHIMHFYGFGMRDNIGQIQSDFKYWIAGSAADIDVYSPCDGTVVWLDPKFDGGEAEYQIMIRPKVKRGFGFGLSHYIVVLDHVADVKVSYGQKIKAGQAVGKPGGKDFFRNSPDGGRLVELSIDNAYNGMHYAPFMFFDPATKARYEAKIYKLMHDIEGRVGNMYNPAHIAANHDYTKMNIYGAGCTLDKIPEKYYLQKLDGYRTDRNDGYPLP